MYQKKYGVKSKRATSFAALQAGFVTRTLLAPLLVVKTRMILNTSNISVPYLSEDVKSFCLRAIITSLVQ